MASICWLELQTKTLELDDSNPLLQDPGREATVWSLSKGKLLRNIIFPAAINALALDPGGTFFYAGSKDSKICIGAMNSSSDYATQAPDSVSEQRLFQTEIQIYF
ncbi:protein ROOT INITIATION DEFECTIVE 3-like [Brassica napus]|uniref:protein ROOT INITIATION DEFECTIVE 3-like n=1 Tax=Brassica napus TaxID=3708 RepID=UPI0006AA7E21|nr:protein ROOT INITIATION DEFECTIVE 3-like [Brassica napus]